MKNTVRILALLLLCCLLISCAPVTVPSETQGSSDTATSADTRESATATISETESEPESATETSSSVPPMSEEERIRYLYEHTEAIEQKIISWGMTHDPELYETFFGLLLDAGINTALVDDEYYGNGLRLCPVAEAAENTGMKLYINTFGDDGGTIAYKMELLLDCPSVTGIYLCDEPHPTRFASLGESVKEIYERLPEAGRWPIGANLFPAIAMGGGSRNYQIVEEYLDVVKPDYLSWDFYPFSSQTSRESRFPIYLANMLQMQILAGKADIPLYTYIQTCRINNQETPSEEQLRLLMNSALALGSETLLLFMVGQHGADEPYTGAYETFSYLISSDCTDVTDAYYRLKDVLTGIHAMKGIYLNYQFLFADFDLYPDALALAGEYRLSVGLASVYGQYQGITCADPDGGAVVGYFTKDAEAGDDALYVVNTDYTLKGDATEYTLHFSGEQTYQIWGSNGLEAIGSGTEITLDILPGDGKFVVLNADNSVPEQP